MQNNLYHLYKRTLSKYRKFKTRYDKGLESGRFFSLSDKKRHLILKRLSQLKERLEKLQLQLKLAAAGAALSLTLSVGTAKAQEIGPFQVNDIDNPLPPPIAKFNQSNPAIVDIDNDGDLDIFIGLSNGTIAYFENDGTPNAPHFIYYPYFDPGSPVYGIDVGNHATPAFADLDGDGDFDLVVGQQYQYYYSPYNNVSYFENNGTQAAPNFSSTPIASPNPVSNLLSDDTNSHPSIVDIDNDGDLDVFVGGSYVGFVNFPIYDYRETVSFWRNNGTTPATFTRESGALNPLSLLNAEFGGKVDDVAPTFIDIDNDGDQDALIGDYDGNIRFFRNDGTANSPIFNAEITGAANPFNGVNLGNYASPEFGDFDNDGDLDMIAGADPGNDFAGLPIYEVLHYYENIGDETNPQFIETTDVIAHPFNGVDVGLNSDPEFADLDGDGDMDLLIAGKSNGPDYTYNPELEYYQNNGSSFSKVDHPILKTLNTLIADNISPVKVAVGDLDGDTDLDMFASPNSFTYGFYYFENNDGVDTYTSFNPTDPNNPINNTLTGNNNRPDIALVDIDNDGDLDAFTCAPNYSEVQMFINNAGFFEQDGTDDLLNGPLGYNGITIKPVDIDHDGDFDVIVGTGSTFEFFNNKGTVSSPNFILDAKQLTGFLVEADAAVDFLDWDQDGDLDAFVGSSDGRIQYYENQNTPPTITDNGTGATYTEGGAAVAVSATLAIGDDGLDDVIGAQVAITNYVAGEDELLFTNQAGITGNFDTVTGILTLSGYATLAQYELVLQSVTYQNISQNPDTTPRVIQFSATDFDATDPLLDTTPEFTTTVNITSVNDAPTLTSANGGTNLNYTQNTSSVVIDDLLDAIDADNITFAGATITITNFQSGDTLIFNDQNGITGSYSNGTLTLSGSANEANYEAALRSIQFASSNGAGTRQIDFTINDGTLDSAPYSRTIVIAANQPPTIATTTETTQFGSQVTIDLCTLSSDPENDALTFNVTNVLSGATTSINGCNLVIDYSGINFSGADEITVEACDGLACDQNNLIVDVVEPTASDVQIYNAISPNGDGENDWWIITGLTAPNRIKIFNRWGDLVKTLTDFESSPTTPNNALDDLPSGTYFYKIDSDSQGSFTGYLVIKK